jgi:hypothetical protein
MRTLSDKEVKTRKRRWCLTCNRPFNAGSMMQRQVTVDDRIDASYICLTCRTLINDFPDHFKDSQEDSFSKGCVQEAMIEDFDFQGGTPEEFLSFLKRKQLPIYPKTEGDLY